GGNPLPPALRAQVEPHFRRDFGDVRVHTDAPAQQAARRIHARAYTAGNQIAFAAGEYRPYHPEGRQLLAHELAHVAQLRDAGAAVPVIRRDPTPDAPSAPSTLDPTYATATSPVKQPESRLREREETSPY